MTYLREFTDANFQDEVLQSNQPVLVDFWAPWCAPCRVLGPTIEELAQQYDNRVTVGKLNVDEHPQAASAQRISSIPAVLLFQNGEVVKSFVGIQPKAVFEEALDRVVSAAAA